MNIIQTIHSRRGFRAFFDDLKTWRAWETYLQALFGLEKPSKAQFRVFQDSTGLRQWPGNVFKESYVVCGRRGGKSTIVSVIAVFLAPAGVLVGTVGSIVVYIKNVRTVK